MRHDSSFRLFDGVRCLSATPCLRRACDSLRDERELFPGGALGAIYRDRSVARHAAAVDCAQVVSIAGLKGDEIAVHDRAAAVLDDRERLPGPSCGAIHAKQALGTATVDVGRAVPDSGRASGADDAEADRIAAHERAAVEIRDL